MTSRRPHSTFSIQHSTLACLMGVLYIAAGINHFIHPEFYRKIMPPWLPAHETLIIVSGIAEVLLGLLMLPVRTRPYAAWGLIALLVAVFPANIQMMLNYMREHNPRTWATILRLPLQFVLIWLAWKYTKPVEPTS